jgi:spore coat protein U-like protein
MNLQKKSFFLIFFLFIHHSIFAASQNTNLAVSATVNDVCTIAADALDFGVYNPLGGADLDAQTLIHVTCTINTAYTVGCSAGAGVGASIATRKLTNAGTTLDYSLYLDNLHANLWGVAGLQLYNGVGTGVTQDVPVYGRITGSQNVPAAAYVDTVQVTVTY